MISQADIIRALVNKNCTDESIMSVALSPDCTPAKLLEKFNDAERFDLALDVSMKLNLDVSPIWKTWGFRCLKNRNFQGARDKFRHCFQRLRSIAARSNLLCDILNELIPMSETKLPLTEEIDLIANGIYRSIDSTGTRGQTSPRRPCTIQSKPKILEECSHYLKEYGTTEDNIKFFVNTSSWKRAAELLLKKSTNINVDKFFIVVVVIRASTTGYLDDLLNSLIEQDPDLFIAQKYYKAMYNYYSVHRRFNSLYYLQNRIGDYVAAAENLITNFYLKRPTMNYKELNSRVARLSAASENYRCHIERLKLIESGPDGGKTFPVSDLLTNTNREESEARQRLINTQLQITENFAINEVHGCINNVDVVTAGPTSVSSVKDDHTPVTLFEDDERRLTFLAALVLVYFDQDCTAYLSTSGLKLANQIIEDRKLDKMNMFKTAMRIIIEDESCDILANARLLLQRLTEDHLATSRRTRTKSNIKTQKKATKHVAIREVANINSSVLSKDDTQATLSSQLMSNKNQIDCIQVPPIARPARPNVNESARILCDDVIRDSIRNCAERDYKMKLTNLLSPEARIEQFIELGNLSNAQRLAFDMKRRDYVASVLREAERLNQDHIKDVCQHWLAKN